MIKRIVTFLTAWTLLLGLCACGQGTSGQADSVGQATWQEQYELGLRYLSEGNYEEAIIAFTAAIEIDPKRAEAYVGRGDAYVLSGETKSNLRAARADYKKAIELDETLAEAYLGLADVYISQEDYDKAQEVLEEGFEKTSDNSIQQRLDEVLLKVSEIIKDDTVDLPSYPIDYVGLTVNDLIELWGPDFEYLDYWMTGNAKPIYYTDLRIPMMFYFLDPNLTNQATGDEEIIIVECYPQEPGGVTEIAPGLPLQSNSAQLAELGYTLTDFSEFGDFEFSATYALNVEYNPEISLIFLWFDYDDPASTPAQIVLIWKNEYM